MSRYTAILLLNNANLFLFFIFIVIIKRHDSQTWTDCFLENTIELASFPSGEKNEISLF